MKRCLVALISSNKIPFRATPSPSARATVTFEEQPKFVAFQRDYGRQYAGLYWYRLERLKPELVALAKTRWPGGILMMFREHARERRKFTQNLALT